MKGYLYVLGNPSMPGIYKVGRSKNGGHSRAADLYTTGVPTPFDVVIEVWVQDVVASERAAHERLEHCRVVPGREFFKCEVVDAVEAVLSVASEDWDLGVVPCELSDFSEIYRISSEIGTNPLILFSLIGHIPIEVWSDALSMWEERYNVTRLQAESHMPASTGGGAQ
jgi:hypothetical protein